MASTRKTDDQYTEQETQRRFMAAVRAALNTSPKPLKDIPRKRPKTQRKAKAKKPGQ